jgi:hypothetical protein
MRQLLPFYGRKMTFVKLPKSGVSVPLKRMSKLAIFWTRPKLIRLRQTGRMPFSLGLTL